MRKIAFMLALFLFATFSKIYSQKLSLGTDPLFIETVKASQLLSEQILEANKNFDLKNISAQIKNIDENLSENDQIKEISKLLTLKNETNFNDFYYKTKENWTLLKQKYEANESEIKNGVEEFYSIVGNKIAPWSGGGSGPGCQDPGTYAACVTVVGVGAQLGYAGCVGALFGAPICFGLVLIAQTAGIKICHSEWCKAH